jgi:DDE superfamily endonuclease
MRLEEIARAKALDTIEIWFADEARIGQKNKITRRWAKRGTRPSAPRDQRTASTYIFGAVCPKRGKGAALILPACNTEAMNLQLAEIAAAVAPAAHAVLLVDQAGWHMSTRLVVPANITIIALPPKCPSSTGLRTCGSSCAITGSRTGSSNHTTISSTIVARPGTSSSISLGASCPSDCANGRTSSDQWDSV